MSNSILKPEKVNELINDALEPQVWKDHLTNDLMKFWDKPCAYTLEDKLFPTYRTNKGEKLSDDKEKWPEEFLAAAADMDTSGLIETDYNFVRAHSRQTYAYGIAFHMTGNQKYLKLCRDGALALEEAIDGNYGMHVTYKKAEKEWDADRQLRTSQDLAYGLTGLGMYYFLTHDTSVLHRIIQIKDYIFNNYMDDPKGYLTWYPKYVNDPQIQIVAQLDQLYAYMLMLTPSLPEPYQSIWKKDMKKIADILITQFYSEHYQFFWGTEDTSDKMSLGTDHTDFGHSVKTFWVILKIGELLGDPFYIDFARPKIDKIIHEAYIPSTGSWARRYNADDTLDTDKEWWILAELDQACEILSIHDPYYYSFLNKTQRYWLDVMVDHDYGEIWHMVSSKDNKPYIQYPKIHNWKTSLHSFEHALFSYMTASRIKNRDIELYYAFPEWETNLNNTSPYMFFGSITSVADEGSLSFMPDGNNKLKIKFNGLH
ncbi:MAG: hypothetical protein Q4F95_13295 [Oscillospiraceae bacterium]|nr:hypothetical protein [Oscillospiraceae bacterium]